MKKLFITGIGTNVGKTVVSAIITEYLKADYWKPIQSGDLHNSDTITVKSLISNLSSVFHDEAYQLNQPMSPHAAARIDGIEIDLNSIKLPVTSNHLVVEGAGGILVPLNDKDLVIDLIEKLNLEVVLVSRNYLGSINHTLLTFQELKRRNISILGIVFNGETNIETENFILNYTNLPLLIKVSEEDILNKETILKYSKSLNFKQMTV